MLGRREQAGEREPEQEMCGIMLSSVKSPNWSLWTHLDWTEQSWSQPLQDAKAKVVWLNVCVSSLELWVSICCRRSYSGWMLHLATGPAGSQVAPSYRLYPRSPHPLARLLSANITLLSVSPRHRKLGLFPAPPSLRYMKYVDKTLNFQQGLWNENPASTNNRTEIIPTDTTFLVPLLLILLVSVFVALSVNWRQLTWSHWGSSCPQRNMTWNCASS